MPRGRLRKCGLLLRGQVLSLDRLWFVLLGGGMLVTLTLQLLVLAAAPALGYAYAKARERLLLCGGSCLWMRSLGTPHADLWAFDLRGQTWQPLPGSHPSVRCAADGAVCGEHCSCSTRRRSRPR